ncbi:MAG: hypothetical protein QM778_30370 [Myxococcales bacterium]
MSLCLIRYYRQEDRAAVRAIAFETGLAGGSIEPQYKDRESFADFTTAYYTDHEPENGIVVELEGKVVGYCLSTRDTRRAIGPFRYLLWHTFCRGVCFRPGTAGYYGRAWLDGLRDLGEPGRTDIDLDRFPSHAHINLLPEARRGGIATEVICRLFDHHQRLGSPGLYAESVSTNLGMAAITKRLGCVNLGEPYLVPGWRGPEGERVRVQVYARDLTSWVPEAWQQLLRKDAGTPPRAVEHAAH